MKYNLSLKWILEISGLSCLINNKIHLDLLEHLMVLLYTYHLNYLTGYVSI